jgi:ATP/maltotriose-dependent transcriptional regulator MalT
MNQQEIISQMENLYQLQLKAGNLEKAQQILTELVRLQSQNEDRSERQARDKILLG